jgi:hypothetical protein
VSIVAADSGLRDDSSCRSAAFKLARGGPLTGSVGRGSTAFDFRLCQVQEVSSVSAQ